MAYYHKNDLRCASPPAGAPFFCFIFLGAQKNEVAEGMKSNIDKKKLYTSLYHNIKSIHTPNSIEQ